MSTTPLFATLAAAKDAMAHLATSERLRCRIPVNAGHPTGGHGAVKPASYHKGTNASPLQIAALACGWPQKFETVKISQSQIGDDDDERRSSPRRRRGEGRRPGRCH